MRDKNIALIIDTNIVYNNYSIKFEDLDLRMFDIFKDFLIETNVTTPYHVDLYVSAITIEELIQHQYEKFIIKFNKLNTLINDIGSVVNLDEIQFDYLKYLRGKWKNQKNDSFIYVLPYPNYKSFARLIEKSFRKYPPFDKTKQGKKTDSGFKDALIWESILQYEDLRSYDQIIFAYKDKVFEDGKSYLKNEFNDDKINMIYINNDNARSELVKYVNNLLDIPITDKTKLYNSEIIKSLLFKYGSFEFEADILNEKGSIVFSTDFKFLNKDNIDVIIVQYYDDESENDEMFGVSANIKIKNFNLDQEEINLKLNQDISIINIFETEIYISIDKINNEFVIKNIYQMTIQPFQSV